MKNKGFTLLFASLVVSLVLSIGLAIANLSIQQFLLSTSGKDSQTAFYSADAAVECALYYDHGKVTGFQFPVQTSDAPGTMNCNGLTSTGVVTGDTSTTTTTYIFNAYSALGTCDTTKPSYVIEVNKHQIRQGSYFTDIKSRGYNTCTATNDSSVGRGVERGLEVKY